MMSCRMDERSNGVSRSAFEERVMYQRRRRERQRSGRSTKRHGERAVRWKKRRERTPQERRYHEARRRANQRMGFLIHFVAYASVLALILVSSRSARATVIVALSWGIGIAIHYVSAIAGPRLRAQWISQEMDRHVEQGADKLESAENANARSLENLSASIAHEIRNPVTAAKSLVQQMGEDPGAADNIQYARVALEELDRVERSISHLLKYARDEESRFEMVDLPDIIRSAVASIQDRIDRQGIEVDVDISAPCRMRGDSEKLRRVLLNLLRNAIDALAESATPTPCIVILAGENLAGREVWLRFRDNGPGMHPDVKRRIFDPFYTTKDDGTGLGLALSKKVVESHGGSMQVQTDADSGSEFLLTFPKTVGVRGANG